MSDSAESNIALLKRYEKAWQTGDMATVNEIFSPNLVGFQNGNSPVAGEFHGFEDWNKRWLQPLIKMTGGQITDGSWAGDKLPTECVFAGDSVMAFTMYESYERAGKGKLVTKRLVIYSIKDGKIVGFRFYDENQKKYDEFFSG